MTTKDVAGAPDGRTDRRPHAVIIVENLALPFDRRVWQEAQALVARGWRVSAICPTSERHPQLYEELEGVAIHRHPLPLEARGASGFLLEYASALYHETRLLARIARRHRVDVIQACNPPDLMFLVALPYKLFGKKFVFDHHDSAPALYEAKFGRRGFFHAMLRTVEKLTFKLADQIVTANRSYRDHAIATGGRSPDDVTAVYSVPNTQRLQRVPPNMALRRDARIVLGYVGIIGDQDGLDHLVRLVAYLASTARIDDVHTVVVGNGPALESVRTLAAELGVADRITFTGYQSGHALLEALSAFDIGIIPDPVNPYNDKISMNKVFEYSALGIPSVAYPLAETRRLLGDTASYADGETPDALARACLPLIADDDLRRTRGAQAKALADREFVWTVEAEKFVCVYDRLVPRDRTLGR